MRRRQRFFANRFSKILLWFIAVFATAPIWAQSNRLVLVEPCRLLPLPCSHASGCVPPDTVALLPVENCTN